MTQPPVEVADIIRAYGDRFIETHTAWLTALHRRVLRALARCRTAALGGHLDRCDTCAHRAISYNSCLMGSARFWGVRITARPPIPDVRRVLHAIHSP